MFAGNACYPSLREYEQDVVSKEKKCSLRVHQRKKPLSGFAGTLDIFYFLFSTWPAGHRSVSRACMLFAAASPLLPFFFTRIDGNRRSRASSGFQW
ncbi:hypothetical protein BDZ88DRAFT_22619 [Geranomyces variabilis]|nr:hypothetical protein BDZ88DRAFT_22619 [Geranomyces variabilis]